MYVKKNYSLTETAFFKCLKRMLHESLAGIGDLLLFLVVGAPSATPSHPCNYLTVA